MSILDVFYKKLPVIREYPSEVTFECPVCKGKIKASKKQIGKWLCVTSHCSVAKVRKKLKLKVSDYHARKGRGTPYPEMINTMSDVPYTSCSSIIGVDKLDYATHRPIWIVDKGKERDGEYESETYYRVGNYSKASLDNILSSDYVYRFDYFDVEKQDYDKKIRPFFQSEIPYFFNQEFLKEKRGVVVFLEGEQAAFHFTLATQLLGLSFPASTGTGMDKLCNYWFPKLKKNLEAILYFPDNDKTGLDKANDFKKISNSHGIPVMILEPYEDDFFKEKNDVVEYIYNLGISSLFNLILEKM